RAPDGSLRTARLGVSARALAAVDAVPRAAVAGGVINCPPAAAPAAGHIATWTPAGGRPPPSPPPASAPHLATSQDAAAWLESERPNLSAALGHAAARDMPQHAVAIATAMGGFLRARGHWDLAASQTQTA